MKRLKKILLISGLSIVIAGAVYCGIMYTIVIFALSPRPGKVEKEIIRQIVHSRSNPAAIQIQIRNVTSFDWEKMYAFRSSTTKKEIEEIIGVHVPQDCEISPQIFFLKNGRIIYQECEPSDFEGVVKDEIYFDMPENAKYKIYLPNALFSAKVEDGKKGPYYVLKQI
jgi:hypothetical protein